MPFVVHPPAGLKKLSLVDGGAAIFVGADDPAARIHGTGRIKGAVGCGRASMPLAAQPVLGVYRPLIRHGPLGRATFPPRGKAARFLFRATIQPPLAVFATGQRAIRESPLRCNHGGIGFFVGALHEAPVCRLAIGIPAVVRGNRLPVSP